jgi:N-acetylmuramoyl-L-alanine amidase
MRQLCRRLLEIGVGLFLWAGLAGAPSHAAPFVTVRVAAVEPAGEGARLVLDLSADVAVEPFFLPAPKPRLVLDLPAGAWNAGRAPVRSALVAGLRHGDAAKRIRLVLDLTQEASLVRATRTPSPRGGVRIVYEFAPAGAAPLSQTAAEPRTLEAPESAPPPVALPPFKRAPVILPGRSPRRVVVIDPGHGGKDSGAPGKSLGFEKDYNLAAGLALRDALEARGYSVVMTRKTDVFLPLPERVKIAREAKADLFISLHSDADPKAQAKGATVYTLSQGGVQRAKALADGQDWNVDLGPASASSRVGSILLDLTQRETTDNSSTFAEGVLSRLDGVAPLNARRPRRAGFFVLLAPDVPAVLLEMGFVTHSEDERRLASASARKAMMDQVAASVDDYFQARKTYASVTP